MLREKSLARRIFLASCLLLPLLLGFSAFMLDRAFRSSLFNAERESLLAHSYSMMGFAEPDDRGLSLPQNLSDPRFNMPESGLYAQVVDESNNPVWQSVSLGISPLVDRIPYRDIAAGELEFASEKINGASFFVSRFTTVWEIDNKDRHFQFVIVHSQIPIKEEIRRYRHTLAIWLGGLALLLILIQTAIIQWGLFPLKRLASDIKQLESGGIDSLDEAYPAEIVPVTNNINLLLESEKQQRKRYKNTLGDLAHSLKTPLSVIRSLLEKPVHKDEHHHAIDEQIDRMDNIIIHQLNRATSTRRYFQAAVSVHPLIMRLVSALDKVYKRKNMAADVAFTDGLKLNVEENDLLEVFGNLLENAYKYGESKILVNAAVSDQHVEFTIEDDGEGVPDTLRQEILRRGARADTSAPGQGIGLAVAADIISTYDGGIRVSQSKLGGACFHITLPR